MASFTRIQLEKWLKTIDVKAERVLDIGGSQLPVKGRTKSWEVEIYNILDLPEPHETKKEPDILMDIQDEEPMLEAGPGYDIVFCLEVAEYWYNPLQALKNIGYFLKEGGILYISFHFIYGIHRPVGTDFLRYTPEGVEELLKRTEFEILEHKYRIGNGIEEMYQRNQMRVRKDIPQNVIGSLITAKKV
ncbi:MAG: hypothetical protein ACTSR2_00530 [Candidatus Hodarchaeales archaeon]